MDSIETLKQEIIKQKTALASKGVTVVPAHTNPSPSEITAGINAIEYADLSQATATAGDVISGKTFYAGNNVLKSGTRTVDGSLALETFVSGRGSYEIVIPTNSECTIIRPYCFAVHDITNRYFYKHNLTIPSNIESIEINAFSGANLTGTVTIPQTTFISGSYSFYNCPMTSVYMAADFESVTVGSFGFSKCANLEQITLAEGITTLPNYLFESCTSLTSITVPSTVTRIGNYICRYDTALQYFKIQSATPPTLSVSALTGMTGVPIVVPYDSYHSYVTGTNYHKASSFIGFKTFEAGASLPASDTQYTLVWYASIADAKSGTNPITTASSSGEYYSIHTAIEA